MSQFVNLVRNILPYIQQCKKRRKYSVCTRGPPPLFAVRTSRLPQYPDYQGMEEGYVYEVKESGHWFWRRLLVTAEEKPVHAQLRFMYRKMTATFALNRGNDNYIIKHVPAKDDPKHDEIKPAWNRPGSSWLLSLNDVDLVQVVVQEGEVFKLSSNSTPQLSMEARNHRFFVVFGNLDDREHQQDENSVIATFKMFPEKKEGTYDVRVHRLLDDHLAIFYFALFQLFIWHKRTLQFDPDNTAVFANTQAVTAGLISAAAT